MSITMNSQHPEPVKSDTFFERTNIVGECKGVNVTEISVQFMAKIEYCTLNRKGEQKLESL